MKRFDQFEHASLTDVGIRRSHNQDNLAVLLASDDEHWRQIGHLFLVADGMGAHAVGEKAAEKAASIIPHTYSKFGSQGPLTALRKAFAEANASIHAFGQQNPEFEGTGTTSTALVLRPEGAWIGHVGDSRAYRIRPALVEQLSYDHSLVWEYARLKNIDPEEVRDIPANVIHRCLGPEALVQIDVEGPHPVLPGDIFVLCSDGLSGQVTDRELGVICSVLPPAEACRVLVDLANLRGGPDNITAVIVRVAGTPSNPGLTPPSVPALARSRPPTPWWLPTLAGGALLTFGAIALHLQQLPGSLPAYLLGAGAIGAGLVGLVLHYNRERNKPTEEEEEPQARIHRSSARGLDQGLVQRVSQAVALVRRWAAEERWELNANGFQEHNRKAEDCKRQGDMVGAFREYCRALMPLTQNLNRRTPHVEEFRSVWDKYP